MEITITYTEGKPQTIAGEEAYKLLFEAVSKYDFEILDNEHLAEVGPLPSGSDQREALRSFAKEYQRAQSELSTSYEELSFWAGFFSKYGEELGLSEEFRENGIL